MLVVFLVGAWFLGLWAASYFSLELSVWAGLSGVGLLAGVIWRKRRPFGLMLACVGFLGLGGLRYTAVLPTIDEHHIAYYNGTREITVTGLVVDEPDVRDRSINLRVKAEAIAFRDGSTQPVSGLIQVRTFRFPPIAYGTRLTLSGTLEAPPEDETFSYKDYLARQGVHSLIALPAVEIVAEGEGSPIYQTIFALKTKAHHIITALLPNPQAALLAGILLGNDNGLSPDLAADFRSTGMTHIIAISGFNIAILIAILVSVTEPLLGRRGAAVFALAGISFYTVLVGADASVVRAALMGTIYLVTSRWLGRPNYAFASLFLAGFLMTAVDPFTLWDVGFQLSFMATLGLMLYADPFMRWTRDRLLQIMPRRQVQKVMGVLSEAVLITLAAQILTLPLMIGYFQQVSLISLLANALILPVQPAVMTWGGLATLAGLVSEPIGQVLAWVAWLPLTYTITFVRLFAAVPYASIPLAADWGLVLFLYGLIGAVTWLARQRREKRQQVVTAVRQNLGQRTAFSGTLVAMLLVVSWAAGQPDGKLHIAFLNVGQGDATFIQTPSGRQILIDGGYYPTVLNEQLGRQMPFWDRRLDMMVATHADADHVSGLVEVFDRYQVDMLITNGAGLGESPIYDEVLLAAEAGATAVHQARAGEVITIEDGVRLEILHPGTAFNEENRNDNSVSMRLIYGRFTFLFTGDAEEKAEQEMLARNLPLQALVFKAGHHGSRSSSTADFLTAVRPRVIVVSAGIDNRFGHPHPEMLRRAAAAGAAVLRTDELGTIEVTSDGETMWWRARP